MGRQNVRSKREDHVECWRNEKWQNSNRMPFMSEARSFTTHINIRIRHLSQIITIVHHEQGAIKVLLLKALHTHALGQLIEARVLQAVQPVLQLVLVGVQPLHFLQEAVPVGLQFLQALGQLKVIGPELGHFSREGIDLCIFRLALLLQRGNLLLGLVSFLTTTKQKHKQNININQQKQKQALY